MREGWIRAKLGECFRLKSGDGLTNKNMISGDFQVFGGNGIAGTHNEHNLLGDNVIIGRVGALCGNARHIKESIWLTDNAFKVVEKKFDFDNAFLTYLLNFKNLRSLARQSAQPVISNSSLKNLYLVFPKSEFEQKRIVAILDEAFEGIDAAIANTEQNLSSARELFESILDQTLNRKDTSRTNTTLGESCEFSNGKAHEKSIDENGKYIVVNSKFISTEGSVIKKTNEQMFPLVANDIAMVMSDVPKGRALAKCYVVEEDNKYTLNQRICCIRSESFIVNYLYFQLNRHPYLLSFDNKGSQANLRKSDILSCPLYMPDIKEQKSIMSKLSSAKEKAINLESVYQQKMDSLNELKQSLLAKAFSGELTAKPEKVLKEAH